MAKRFVFSLNAYSLLILFLFSPFKIAVSEKGDEKSMQGFPFKELMLAAVVSAGVWLGVQNPGATLSDPNQIPQTQTSSSVVVSQSPQSGGSTINGVVRVHTMLVSTLARVKL